MTYPCRAVAAGRRALVGAADVEVVRDRIDSLLAGIAAPGADDDEVPFLITAVTAAPVEHGRCVGMDRYRLAIDGQPAVEAGELWEVEDELLQRVNQMSLFHADPGTAHLHGALVSDAGRGVLLTGTSGSGKSTLTTRLVLEGWSYHTDETIPVGAEGVLRPYRRPLTLKAGSWPLFPDVPSVPADPQAEPPARARAHIPPAELGPLPSDRVIEARLIVFVRYRPGPMTWRPVSALEAADELIANSLDLSRAGVGGVQRLVDVATRAAAIRLNPGDGDPDAVLRDALRRPFAPSAATYEPPVQLRGGARTGRSGPRQRACDGDSWAWRLPTVHTWYFHGDGALLFEPVRGQVVRLDPSGAALWAGLSEPQRVGDVIEAVADAAREREEAVAAGIFDFFSRLAADGLLRLSPGPGGPGPETQADQRRQRGDRS